MARTTFLFFINCLESQIDSDAFQPPILSALSADLERHYYTSSVAGEVEGQKVIILI